MNKREYLLGTAETSAKVRKHIKENGMSIATEPNGIWQPQGVPAPSTCSAKFGKATDEEIDNLYAELGIEFTEEVSETVVVKTSAVVVPSELYADEKMEEGTNAKGEKYPILMLPYSHRTKGKKNRNFAFAMKNGMSVSVNPYDNVVALGLQEGDLFPINPDTLIFTKNEGFLFAKPNFTHSTFSDIVDAREDLADEMEKWEAERRIKGMTQKEISAERTETIKRDSPMPTLKGFKFVK
jgi:hypothetical protein